ncbi:MAG: hypothetical protein V4671_14420 [Armatimonadota bacterium]
MSVSHVRRTVVSAVLALLLGYSCLPRADAAAPQTGRPVARKELRHVPKTLRDALPDLYWDPASRGPLLIVAPQTATLVKRDKNPLPPPVRVSGVYRLPDLVEYFGRRTVRLNGITVVAPAEMVVLNRKLPKPDIYADMFQSDKIRMMLASLTPAQWHLLVSTNGLGMGDMDEKQRDLFDSVLPKPLMYTTRTAGSNEEETSEFSTKRTATSRTIITDVQRSGVRLRIHRETRFSLPPEDSSSRGLAGSISREAPGTPILNLYQPFDRGNRTYFGAKLTEKVPNRLKPSQIDFSSPALAVPVSIAEAETVGELIDRIRATTRVEIYADRRLARLPVWTRTTGPNAKLRAGEVLKALCWGVAGAVRSVRGADTGVFILTDDLDGLGIRRGAISEWTMDAFSAERKAKEQSDLRIRERNVIESIKFAPDEDFTPTDEQMTQIQKGWSRERTRHSGVPFPMNVLPPDLQERLRRTAVETNEARAKGPIPADLEPPVSDKTVNISVQIEVSLEVPDVGSIPLWGGIDGLDAFLPPLDSREPLEALGSSLPETITLPARAKIGGVLCVTPADEEESRTAVRAARARGLSQVWIAALPEREDATQNRTDPETRLILAAAIQEAETSGRPLSVLAGVRVLSTPPKEEAATAETLDRIMTGQSPASAVRERLKAIQEIGGEAEDLEIENREARDWLQPDRPEVVSRIIARLSDLAAVPGLGGIVLTDVLAPGYRYSAGNYPAPNSNYTDVGYTPDRRIAAIRTLGYDPVDIVLSQGYIAPFIPGPPFFESESLLSAYDAKSPIAAWNALRFQSAKAFLNRLYTVLSDTAKQGAKPFPVFMESIDRFHSREWFGTWDKPDKLPHSDSLGNASRASRAARAVSAVVLKRHPLRPLKVADTSAATPAEKFTQDFNGSMRTEDASWDGHVFDLRDQPMDRVLEILQNVTPQVPVRGASR